MAQITRRKYIAQIAMGLVGNAYAYGGTGQKCTVKNREARIKQYASFEAAIKKNCPIMSGKKTDCNGCKWQGKCMYDCAQLSKKAAKAAGYQLESGATSQWKKTKWEHTGTIDTLPKESEGIILFVQQKNDPNTMSHVGVGVGNGMSVDARGHDYGVVKRSIASSGYTHWAELPGLDDLIEIDEESNMSTDNPIIDTPVDGNTPPTIRKGNKGQYVELAQSLLMSKGYDLPNYGTDGDFGSETYAAAKAFQKDNKLTVDGVIGPKTWAALIAPKSDGDQVFNVLITGQNGIALTSAQAIAVMDLLQAQGYDVERKQL